MAMQQVVPYHTGIYTYCMSTTIRVAMAMQQVVPYHTGIYTYCMSTTIRVAMAMQQVVGYDLENMVGKEPCQLDIVWLSVSNAGQKCPKQLCQVIHSV